MVSRVADYVNVMYAGKVIETGTIIFALMLTGWMEMSVIARTQVLRLKDQEFAQAARTLGAGNAFILFQEILPNIAGTLITQIMVSIPRAIFL